MRVADTYKNWEYDETKSFEKGNKLYVKAITKCDRCVQGVYVTRIENGMPVPHPNAGGVCFQCEGTGFMSKEVRLYTEKEFNALEKAKEARKIKNEKLKEEKRQERIAKAAETLSKALEREGFNAEGYTYIAIGNTYAIKDTLKELGFKFNPVLLWHSPEKNYEEVIEIYKDDIFDITEEGQIYYKSTAKDFIENAVNELTSNKASSWIGEVKDKIENLNCTITAKVPYTNRFGSGNIIKFINDNKNELSWFTSVVVDAEIGDRVLLSGTVKKLDTYKGTKVTVMTRCKVR